MPREDLTPAERMLYDNPKVESTPTVYSASCYICNDPDFSRMGFPLCFPCSKCGGHVQADGDMKCDDCGHDTYEDTFPPEDNDG